MSDREISEKRSEMDAQMRDALRYWGERHSWNFTAILNEVYRLRDENLPRSAAPPEDERTEG